MQSHQVVALSVEASQASETLVELPEVILRLVGVVGACSVAGRRRRLLGRRSGCDEDEPQHA